MDIGRHSMKAGELRGLLSDLTISSAWLQGEYLGLSRLVWVEGGQLRALWE